MIIFWYGIFCIENLQKQQRCSFYNLKQINNTQTVLLKKNTELYA